MNQALSLATLVKQFDTTTRLILEQSISQALQYQHKEVQLEHVLHNALQHPESQFETLCNDLHMNTPLLAQQLSTTLEKLPKQTQATTPHLAHTLVDIIQTAWQIASLEYHANTLHIGHLLAGAIRLRDELRYCCTLDAMQTLDAEQLTHALETFGTQPAQPQQPQKQQDILAQYTENLTEKAAQKKIDPVIGRESETHQLINILCRRRQNNPILVGEAGVGKTAIVEGFALQIQEGNVPDKFKNTQLLALDVTALQAGASMKGEFEQRLKDIINAVQIAPEPTILFIDEVHNLIGAGSKSEAGDAANLLKPALARGELRTIAATTYAEYKKHIEHDAALTRRFEIVKVNEPTQDQAVAILRGIKSKLEQHHQVTIDDVALNTAVRLSMRYIPSRQLPDKAVCLLDTACARAQLSQTTLPNSLVLDQAKFAQTQQHYNQLEQEQKFSDAHAETLLALAEDMRQQKIHLEKLSNKVEQEKNLFNDIKNIRHAIQNQQRFDKKELTKTLHKLAKVQNETPLVYPSVNSELIANVVSNWTGIPLNRMLKDEVNTTLSLTTRLKKRIIGQDNAVKTIAEHLQVASANLHDPNKPRGIFLLAGTSGVGKTETALALADLLYGGEQNLTVINMSEFKEPHKVSMLTGAPAGYVGYGEGGILTEAVKRKPYSVILLDEMEKAHPSIQEVFYQVFDKGVMMDGEGCAVDFKNTLILMASNAGTDVMMQMAQNNEDAQHKKQVLHQLDHELKRIFKPAFLGRVTVVPYQPLLPKTLSNIIKIKLAKIQDRVEQQYQTNMTFTASLTKYIAQKCTDVSTGARNIDLIINQDILPKISQFFLTQLLEKKAISAIKVSIKNQKLCIEYDD